MLSNNIYHNFNQTVFLEEKAKNQLSSLIEL